MKTTPIYEATRYRVTKTKSPPQATVYYNPARLSPLAQLQQRSLPSEVPTPFSDLIAGMATELKRTDVLDRVRVVDDTPMRALEWLFLADWLTVEAWVDGRWVLVTLGDDELPTKAQLRARGRTGRPRLEDDPVARSLYEEGEKIRQRTPGITRAQIAARLNMSEFAYKRYVSRFRPR